MPGVHSMIQQSLAALDSGDISAVTIFAGEWLSREMNPSRAYWDALQLPYYLQQHYYPSLGKLDVQVRDGRGGPVTNATVTLEIERGWGWSTSGRKRTAVGGGARFGGWAGRGKTVAYRLRVAAAGFEPTRVRGVVFVAGQTKTTAVNLSRSV